MRKHNLKPGPLRHKELSPDLLSRIEKVRSVLTGVLPMTEEEWIDGLKRDQNPEQEVIWWERAAQCYTDFTSARTLSPTDSKAVFSVISGLLSALQPCGSWLNPLITELMESMTGTLNFGEHDRGNHMQLWSSFVALDPVVFAFI